jgi:hypothetical protein
MNDRKQGSREEDFRDYEERDTRAAHGLTRTLVSNAVNGVASAVMLPEGCTRMPWKLSRTEGGRAGCGDDPAMLLGKV